jgi:hypothetical protein
MSGNSTPSTEAGDFVVASVEDILTNDAMLVLVLPAVINELTGILGPAIGRKITFQQLAGMTAPLVSPLVLPALNFSDPRNSALF